MGQSDYENLSPPLPQHKTPMHTHCHSEQRVTGVGLGILASISVLAYPIYQILPLSLLYGVFFFIGVSALSGVQVGAPAHVDLFLPACFLLPSSLIVSFCSSHPTSTGQTTSTSGTSVTGGCTSTLPFSWVCFVSCASSRVSNSST